MEPNAEHIQQAITIGRLILAVVPLASIISVIVSVWNARRKPSVSEEVYRDYATKKELADLRTDFNQTMSEFFSRQHINQSAVEDKFQAILHSVGRIEGELKTRSPQ
jgi:predicted NAD/FAD-binding protein